MLQWTWGCKYLKTLLSIILDLYPEVGLLGSMVKPFNVLRTCHAAFHSCCTFLCSRQQCTMAPFSLRPGQHLFSVFLIVFIRMGVRSWFVFPQWLVMVSIFSCPYWPFACLLLGNVYSSPLLIFEWGCFLVVGFWSSLYIPDISSDIRFASIFSPSPGCLFTLLLVSFDAQIFF